ncbi:mechanosensitive ion channel family protein [Pantanalinema rosaneae CENA516]|uniref:mechanosensitive ion channel family protein n=1 Tax=Pantanalinema rosaneae TaxID=1620701 RepID=UPI003D6E0E9D
MMLLATYTRQPTGSSCRWSRLIQAGVGAIAVCLLPITTLPGQGQQPNLPGLNLTPLKQTLQAAGNNQISTAQVSLDGYRLFAITAPALVDGQDLADSPRPINQRLQSIEATLNRIVQADFEPENLDVRYSIDSDSRLPVISVNDQYLMTVTTLDAQIHGSDPERLANQLTVTIQNALLRARQERQPEFLTERGLIAVGVLAAMLTTSGAIVLVQRRVRNQQKHLQPQSPDVSTSILDADADRAASAQHMMQLQQQQQYSLHDVKRRVLQIVQVGIWSGGTFTTLGLFPYTRWLQTVALSTPLKVIAIGLGVYVLIRLSDTLIDRLFGVFEKEQLSMPRKPQRLALRISTVSRVAKSATTILLIGTGTLTGLAVLGVNLVPLLAGAGIIGLAISFASQNFIKDVINGFLILFEDQYAVGDVIAVGDIGGLVENMNLRITQLRDNEGRLITIPNSQISIVQNLSKDWSRVDLTIDVSVNSDPDQALDVLKQLAEEMYHDRAWHHKILEPPEVLGIDKIDHAGMLIRVWIKTQPLQQWAVGREFRRRLKPVMAQAGLAVGTPHQSLCLSSQFFTPPDSQN